MRKHFIIWIMFAVLLPAGASADEITLAVLGDFPPFQWEDAGEVTGIDADIIREVCRRLGIGLKFRVMPWKKALKSAEDADISGLAAALHTENRAEHLYYTRENVHIQKNVIMIRKDSDLSIRGFDDLRTIKTGVVRDFSYGPEFDNIRGLNKEVYGDQKELLRMLAARRIDAVSYTHLTLPTNREV